MCCSEARDPDGHSALGGKAAVDKEDAWSNNSGTACYIFTAESDVESPFNEILAPSSRAEIGSDDYGASSSKLTAADREQFWRRTTVVIFIVFLIVFLVGILMPVLWINKGRRALLS